MEELVKIKNLHRFNNSIRIKEENLAEHSFYLLLFGNTLFEIIAEDMPANFMKYALIHDVAELITGDIPHKTKQSDKVLKEAVDAIECANFPILTSLKESLIEHTYDNTASKQTMTAYEIFKIADEVSAIFYMKTEEMLGNKSFEYEKMLQRVNEQLKFFEISYDILIEVVNNTFKGDLHEESI